MESEDTDGRIAELVTPGDCSDLCSAPDRELGAFIVKAVNSSFDADFESMPNAYVDGKVTARQLRCKFTRWVADAVADLYTNHKAMVRRAFDKCGITIDLDGYDKHKIEFPNFLNYKPPEKDEVFRENPFTEDELKALEAEEVELRKQRKAARKRKRENEQIERNKRRVED